MQPLIHLLLQGFHLFPKAFPLADIPLADAIQQLGHDRLGVGGDGDAGRVVFADGLAIQQHVDHLFRQLHANANGGAIVEGRAQNQRQIAGTQPILNRVVAPDSPPQGRSQGQGVIFGESALGAVTSHYRGTQPFRQPDDLLCAALGLDLFSDKNHRTPGLQQGG